MIKKALLIILLTTIFTMLLISTASSAFAAPKKVKQQIAETPPATKAEKINAAQLQAIAAQLRFWQGQEKAKPKPSEAAKLGLVIGQNVKALWLQKYTIEEALKTQTAPVAAQPPAQKNDKKPTGEKER